MRHTAIRSVVGRSFLRPDLVAPRTLRGAVSFCALYYFDMQYDILALGDTAVDAFIRIKDASVNCDLRHEHCMICLRFGDKVPFEFAEVIYGVGNSANAAVACARLGLSTSLRAYVGADED